MQVILDPHAGVCAGVLRAIRLAEQTLVSGTRLAAVGPLIHNPIELERLSNLGLQTVAQEIFEQRDDWISDLQGATLLIRTHGIPAALRKRFEAAQFKILDATCPRVLRS
ncbi:hypothetical protein L0128_22565, partial [candidate division KSB1 bacterium]|nr:hypothetical protein [candidate division KSB1 bacterium]